MLRSMMKRCFVSVTQLHEIQVYAWTQPVHYLSVHSAPLHLAAASLHMVYICEVACLVVVSSTRADPQGTNLKIEPATPQQLLVF